MNARFAKNLLISGILLGLSISSVTATLKVVQRSRRLLDAKNELAALEKQKSDLEKEAEYRRSAEFVEMEARNKLNMVKPGEEIYLKPKIMGDDLLGATDSRFGEGKEGKKGWIFRGLFDKIKEMLVLFQS